MAIKFQYNKTSLTSLGKQLKVRQKALPTLQNKESALRLEVRKAKEDSERVVRELEAGLKKYDYLAALWNEFEPGLVAITDVELYTAKVAGVKSIAMLPQKNLLPLTGYVHGGCSPIGMKKPFPTWIDETALLTDAFCCSAGRLGAQIETDPQALADYIGAEFADVTEE